MKTAIARLATMAALVSAAAPTWAAPDGAEIMAGALAHRPKACCIYQELTLILSDADGENAVRRLRWFERREADGSSRVLLAFVAPAEVRGASVLLSRDAGGNLRGAVQLPALGKPLDLTAASAAALPLAGSDFQLADLLDGLPGGFTYAREADAEIDRAMHHVVRATPPGGTGPEAGTAARRHFLRKGDGVLVRTDFLDEQGTVVRRQSFRDVRAVGPGAWQADMILMEDFGKRHRSLLKVERRVFSPDYVPPDVFTPRGLAEGRHLLASGATPRDR